MNYGSYKNSMSDGEIFHKKVEAIFEAKKYNVVRASRRQDITEHWDIRVWGAAKDLYIEIKAGKRIARRDNKPRWDIIVIESQTVADKNGKSWPGWIYGKSTRIVFERPNAISVFRTGDVLRRFERLCRKHDIDLGAPVPKNSRVNSSNVDKHLYIPYTRVYYDRELDRKVHKKDVFVFIRWKDLDGLDRWTHPKKGNHEFVHSTS
jgi:hypothetical protein